MCREGWSRRDAGMGRGKELQVREEISVYDRAWNLIISYFVQGGFYV